MEICKENLYLILGHYVKLVSLLFLEREHSRKNIEEYENENNLKLKYCKYPFLGCLFSYLKILKCKTWVYNIQAKDSYF